MKIAKTKYNIGDKLYIIKDKNIYTTCPSCKGKPTHSCRGYKYVCPKCDGRGEKYVYVYSVYLGTVSEIIVYIEEQEVKVQYKFFDGGCSCYEYENKVYETEKAAKKALKTLTEMEKLR